MDSADAVVLTAAALVDVVASIAEALVEDVAASIAMASVEDVAALTAAAEAGECKALSRALVLRLRFEQRSEAKVHG